MWRINQNFVTVMISKVAKVYSKQTANNYTALISTQLWQTKSLATSSWARKTKDSLVWIIKQRQSASCSQQQRNNQLTKLIETVDMDIDLKIIIHYLCILIYAILPLISMLSRLLNVIV